MEIIISKKQRPLRILFHSWHTLQHSYGICSAFLLIFLEKNYGLNGEIKKRGVDIYVEEAPFYNKDWNNKKKLVYTKEYNDILRNIKIYNGEEIDVIYRQTYPYNINVYERDKDIPKCVFYTSEFSKLTREYFKIDYPANLIPEEYDNYIKSYINNFKNLYFTTPSLWSAKGMLEYLKEPERNEIIPHGVDTSIFKKHKNNLIRDDIRKKYNIKEDDILMINIGAMTTNKGILLILETLNIIVNRQNDYRFKLLLKGSGDLYQCQTFLTMYFDEFKKKGVMTINEINNLFKNHIIFIDKTLSFECINDLFNACDLYISPYLAEGFNLVPLEALSSGLSILVPKTGSTKEYIEEIYKNGGENYIYYVDSIVNNTNNICQNSIKIEDLYNVLNNNKDKFKNKSMNDYTKMINHIDKNMSWNKISHLMYNLFLKIKNTF